MQFSNYKHLLPSKRFAVLSSTGLVLAVVLFAVFFMPSRGENYRAGGEKKLLPLEVQNMTVLELLASDVDLDGVADWEEALWGTDKAKPATFGKPDRQYIADKKRALNIESNAIASEAKLTETERFAREFFASYSALKSSGEVDRDTINNFSRALGQKIGNPELPNRYDEKDILYASTDDVKTRQQYYAEMQRLFRGYQAKGLGEELSLVEGEALAGTSAGIRLAEIARAYQSFASDVMRLPVPKTLAVYHFKIGNGAYNTGESVRNLAKISSDPIVGLSGLSQYQRWSGELVLSVAALEDALVADE